MSCSKCVEQVVDTVLGKRRCHFCGQDFDAEPCPPYRLNTDRNVVVSTDHFWLPIKDCPRAAKVFLLGAGHSATVGEYNGDPFWVGYFPIPRIPKELL